LRLNWTLDGQIQKEYMPITIQIEKVTQLIPMTIETPHYYKQCLDSDDGSYDSTIFGKITEDYIIYVQKSVHDFDKVVSYEVEKEIRPNLNNYKGYLTNIKYKSNKQEFDDAFHEMKQFIEQEGI
jgi:cyclophilin family peptidyl-prolyl cis-trans isomerase